MITAEKRVSANPLKIIRVGSTGFQICVDARLTISVMTCAEAVDFAPTADDLRVLGDLDVKVTNGTFSVLQGKKH